MVLDEISKGMSMAGKERSKDQVLGHMYTLTIGKWRDTKERDGKAVIEEVGGEPGECGMLTRVLCAEAKIELNIQVFYYGKCLWEKVEEGATYVWDSWEAAMIVCPQAKKVGEVGVEWLQFKVGSASPLGSSQAKVSRLNGVGFPGMSLSW